MTFLELQRYVYRRTGHADTPVTAVSDRIKQFLNERHRELLTMEGIDKLRQQTLTFSSDTSNSVYGFPQAVTRILGVHERDNDYPLDYMPLYEYRTYSADPSAYEGTPAWYTELGESPVQRQPPSGKEISVKSSVAGDTAITPYYEVISGNDRQRTKTGALLNGTTAVSADTALKNITHITNFFISDTAVGEVTLSYAGDTTVDGGGDLAVIPVGSVRARYFTIALIPKPVSAITYYMDADVSVTDMIQNTDMPRLPVDFHWLIAQGGLIDEYQKQEKERESKRSELAWFNGIKALKNYVMNNQDYLPVIGRNRHKGISRLGPFYPADYFPFS